MLAAGSLCEVVRSTASIPGKRSGCQGLGIRDDPGRLVRLQTSKGSVDMRSRRKIGKHLIRIVVKSGDIEVPALECRFVNTLFVRMSVSSKTFMLYVDPERYAPPPM